MFVEYRPDGEISGNGAITRVAECADEHGMYWSMHHRLFHRQPLDQAALHRMMSEITRDREALQRCTMKRDSERPADTLSMGRALGVTANPTFFIGRAGDDAMTAVLMGKINRAQPYEQFRAALNWMASIPR